MKILVVLIITTTVVVSSSKLCSYKLASIATDCAILLPVQANTETIFVDMTYNLDIELKTCILKNSHSEQSVVLLNMYIKDIPIQVNATKENVKTTDNPNLIIMTKYLTWKIINSPLLQYFLQSHWSLVYIIITNDKKFQCDDGTMSRNDFLLLENVMNKIWHKFKIMYVGVALPYACKQKMVVYNGKRLSDQTLYDRPIQLINVTNSKDLYSAILKSGEKLADDYPIRGSIFHRHPTCISDCEKLHYYLPFHLNATGGYCGLDALVMYDMLLHFKFKLSFPNEDKCYNYGYVMPGNITGSLGCIIRNELDISFNSRFMTLYSNENIYYLHYVICEKLCALVRMPGIVPVWHGVFNVYTDRLWLLIVVVILAIGFIMWTTAKISKVMTGKQTMSFWFYLNDAVMTTMFGCSLRKTRTFLVLRSSCLFASILFLGVYQGHINHVYTTLQRFKRIDTLDELYRSGATLYTSPAMRQIARQLQNPDNKLQEDFFNRSVIMPGDRLDDTTPGVILQHTSATILDRKLDATIEIFKQYSDEEGNALIDIVDECLYTYYLSYITRSGFPFFEEIQLFIERLTEAGLPTMYYKWTQQMLGLPTTILKNHKEPRPFSKITLGDLRIHFAILFLGGFGSVLVFIAEVWRDRRHRFRLYKRRTS